MIGNLLSDKVKIDDNEENNPVVRTWEGSGKLPKITITKPPSRGHAHHH